MEIPRTIRRALVLLLSSALALPGCATSRATGVTIAPTGQSQAGERSALADYAQRLPPGSAIRLDLSNGKSIRGTLMRASDTSLTVQPRTRVPEPVLDVPMATVTRVTLESPGGGNLAKAIGIGAAAGAGAALAVFLIIVAIYSN